jgi:hypothetical protein
VQLQARADGEARISLLPAFRAASLVTDALAARPSRRRARLDGSPPSGVRSAEIAALNDALRDALRDRASRRGLRLKEAERATAELDRLAGSTPCR